MTGRRCLSGLRAVAALLISALVALLSALMGWPRPGRTRHVIREVRAAWHQGTRTMPPPVIISVTRIED